MCKLISDRASGGYILSLLKLKCDLENFNNDDGGGSSSSGGKEPNEAVPIHLLEPIVPKFSEEKGVMFEQQQAQ